MKTYNSDRTLAGLDYISIVSQTTYKGYKLGTAFFLAFMDDSWIYLEVVDNIWEYSTEYAEPGTLAAKFISLHNPKSASNYISELLGFYGTVKKANSEEIQVYRDVV